jgi:hypothetical protein
MAKSTISRYTPFKYAASAFCTLFPMNGYLYNLIAFVLLGLSDTQRYRGLALQCFQAEQQCIQQTLCKKRFAIFPSPDGMSFTKLPLAENNLIIPGQGKFGK